MAMSRDALKRLIDQRIFENTQNQVTAGDPGLNEVLSDMNNSYELVTPLPPPTVRLFSIQGQPAFVDPNTELSGLVTFLYQVTDPTQVSGNLTISQGVSDLATNVDPAQTSVDLTLNTVTLNAGASEKFTISGTDGTNPFARDFVVTARVDSDYVYIWTSTTLDPNVFPGVGSSSRSPIVAGSQDILVPNYTDPPRYVYIAQPSNDPNITRLLIDNADQIEAFNETTVAFQINAVNYDVFASDNPILSAHGAGETITLVR